MPVSSVTTNPLTIHPVLLKPADVMARLGYKDRAAFFRMARSRGLPIIRINRRVLRFESGALESWLKRRGA